MEAGQERFRIEPLSSPVDAVDRIDDFGFCVGMSSLQSYKVSPFRKTISCTVHMSAASDSYNTENGN